MPAIDSPVAAHPLQNENAPADAESQPEEESLSEESLPAPTIDSSNSANLRQNGDIPGGSEAALGPPKPPPKPKGGVSMYPDESWPSNQHNIDRPLHHGMGAILGRAPGYLHK